MRKCSVSVVEDRKKRIPTCHELDDVDSEMLVYHRAQPHTRSGEVVQHCRIRCVDYELHMILISRKRHIVQ